MKTVALRVEDTTLAILENQAKKENITISEYLRKQIFPLIEGTKPLTLEQCLAKLETSISILQLCLKPLQELVFDLQKFEAEFILKMEKEKEKDGEAQKTDTSEIEPPTA